MAKLTKEDFISSLKEMNLLDAPSTVTVSIADAGAGKVGVIKAVKEITGLGLKEAKDIVDSNGVVKENIPTAEADEIKAKLEEAGATVEVK